MARKKVEQEVCRGSESKEEQEVIGQHAAEKHLQKAGLTMTSEMETWTGCQLTDLDQTLPIQKGRRPWSPAWRDAKLAEGSGTVLTHDSGLPQFTYMHADICLAKCQQGPAQSVMLTQLGLHPVMYIQV